MRRKDLNRKQKNILIGSLLAVVVLMAVGYAAFSTSLNINGTASVSSTWDIKITSVTAKNIVGSASNNTNVTTYSNLSATLAANLVSPGDSISYDIVVTNNGSVDAKLDTITGPTSNNAAITMSKSGLTAGDTISAGSTKTLTVTIGYSSSVTSQPNSTTAQSTISLSFSQYVAPSITYVYAWNEDLNLPKFAVFYGGPDQSTLSEIAAWTTYSSFAEMNAVPHRGAIRNFGVKYGIENGGVTEAYACGLFSGEEICLQGSNDGSTWESNKQILNEKLNCNCTSNSECYCNVVGGMIAIANSVGWSVVSDGNCSCLINNAFGHCYEGL